MLIQLNLISILLPTLVNTLNESSQQAMNSSTMKSSKNSTRDLFISDHGLNRRQGHLLNKRQNSDYKLNVKRNSDSSKSVFSDKQDLYYVNNAVNSNNYETANFHVNRRGNEFQSSNNMGEMVVDKSSYDPSGYHKLTTHDPSFDDNIKRNITIPQGGTAFLQCKINHLGDRTVSWVRQKDLHILTSGRDTYTSDSRFRSINLPNSNEWTLEIRDTRLSDSGIYECQISTDPKMSTSVHLSVIALKTIITQGANLYLKKGANINLTCLINYIPDPESNSLIIWQHSDQIINYDSRGRGAKLTASQISSSSGSKLMISNLLINSATSSDSGNYTCRLTSTSLPSHYAKPALTHVHVLNGGENPAAMQGGATSTSVHLKCANYLHGSSLFCIFAGIVNYFYLSSMVPMLLTWFLIR